MDVSTRPEPSDDLTAAVPKGLTPHQKPAILTVCATSDPEHKRVRGHAAYGPLPRRQCPAPVVGVNCRCPSVTLHLFAIQPQVVEEPLVVIIGVAIRPRRPDQLGNGLSDGPEALGFAAK